MTSTVVGHFKTCIIVLIGWIGSKKPVTDGSLLGIVMAVGGIVGYVGLLDTSVFLTSTDAFYAGINT